MSDDLVRRANMALDDIQGRVDASKLQVFEECIDLIEYLTEQLEAARLDAKEAEAYSVWLEAKLAKAEVIVRIIASAEFDERIGEAVDLSCEYLAELEGDKT